MGTLVATAPPGSIQGIGPTGPTSPYGLPTGGVPYYGSPPGKEKEKGPSMGEVVSDNLSVAKAKVAGGSHKASLHRTFTTRAWLYLKCMKIVRKACMTRRAAQPMRHLTKGTMTHEQIVRSSLLVSM